MVRVLEEDGTGCTDLPNELIVVSLYINVCIGGWVIRVESVKVGFWVRWAVLMEVVPCGDNSGSWKWIS